MIKVLIVEDEIPARKKLKRFISELNTEVKIAAEVETVSGGITFLKANSVDLIFSDIELLDGNSFEIYSQVSILCPVIFTTAYDQFWMNAFESNGIDYLLKPFSQERFQKSWNKFLMFRNSNSLDFNAINNFTTLIQKTFAEKQYKKRFTVNTRHGIYFLEIENILFFEASAGVVIVYDTQCKKHILTESTIKEIEEQLNPDSFFRINRSELINKAYIEKIERYNKNSLAIKIRGYEKYLKTSQNNTAIFREWVEK
ncbi:MAG: response regulator transcription factor [Sphingobacteriales bacterium]|nr:response regulator transcription factor [Sphingobacteriales bacterium]